MAHKLDRLIDIRDVPFAKFHGLGMASQNDRS